MSWFTKREADRGASAHAFSGAELRLELRSAKHGDSGLLCLGQKWSKETGDVCASLDSHGFRGTEQLRRQSGLARRGRTIGQGANHVKLRHPVIDLVSDAQSFCI